MGTVTYLNGEVIDFINAHFITLQISSEQDQNTFNEFDVQWTPTFIIYDQKKKEHHRATGFLSPEEFISDMRLGLAKLEFHLKHYNEAVKGYRQILQAFPQAAVAPEALYFSGVCNYMATHDPSRLKETFTELKEKYPQSDWTQEGRSLVIRFVISKRKRIKEESLKLRSNTGGGEMFLEDFFDIGSRDVIFTGHFQSFIIFHAAP